MNNTKNFIDLSLTPKNTHQRGYKYIDDIIYNEQNPNEDILNLIHKYGYRLGSPSQSKETNIYYGLYMPIGESTK